VLPVLVQRSKEATLITRLLMAGVESSCLRRCWLISYEQYSSMQHIWCDAGWKQQRMLRSCHRSASACRALMRSAGS
jgi:hypothetical protein